MRRILFVLPSLEYGGAAKQVSLLACGLPRSRFEARACALGREGPAATSLRAAGIPVEVLGGPRVLHLSALWRLRRLVGAFGPDVIHAWGRPSVRAAALAAGRTGSRLVASAPFPDPGRGAGLGPLDRWALRRADRVVARGPDEARRCRLAGLPGEKVIVVPPGVEAGKANGDEGASTSGALPPSPLIACAGRLEPSKGFGEALWAFDILQFVYEHLHLVLIGTGPDRERLERFAAGSGWPDHIHFAGSRADVPALLARADVVWVPSRAGGGGVNVALEAMARGRVVVASRRPGLAEVIADGATGFLVSPGSQVELARQTHRLLDDPDLRRRMGEAARQRAAGHFAAEDLRRRYADLYLAVRVAA